MYYLLLFSNATWKQQYTEVLGNDLAWLKNGTIYLWPACIDLNIQQDQMGLGT